MKDAVEHHTKQLIVKWCVEFFRIFFYSGDADKNLCRKVFRRILERDDVCKGIMFQEFFVDYQKEFIITKSKTDISSLFPFFTDNWKQLFFDEVFFL